MKRLFVPLLTASALMSSAAHGAVEEEDLEQLRRQLAEISQRLESLAAENAELKRAQAAAESAIGDVEASVATVSGSRDMPSSESWTDRIALAGDFRYRYESIDAEGSSTRNRNRIRARTNVTAKLSNDVKIGFGLATGGDDPVSTNQTLGGGGSSKGIVLDLAYVDWGVADGWNVLGGKFKNPLFRAGGQPLMWDGDWTPEGLAIKYKRDRFFVNAIGTFLESDSRRTNDNFSWGAQFGATGEFAGAKVKGGIAYYSIETQGDSTTFGDPSDPGDYYGNSAIEASGLPCGTTPDTSCEYLYDFQLTEVFGEASFDVGSWPTTVFFDYVNNSDPSDNDTAWTIGAKVKPGVDDGKWQFTYYYAEKEADSLLGLLTDSDFGGGGTDSDGHWLKLNYSVGKNLTLGAQYFVNETDLLSGNTSDYDRLMLDAQWKWK